MAWPRSFIAVIPTDGETPNKLWGAMFFMPDGYHSRAERAPPQ
jgi:hypothetical protein